MGHLHVWVSKCRLIGKLLRSQYKMPRHPDSRPPVPPPKYLVTFPDPEWACSSYACPNVRSRGWSIARNVRFSGCECTPNLRLGGCSFELINHLDHLNSCRNWSAKCGKRRLVRILIPDLVSKWGLNALIRAYLGVKYTHFACFFHVFRDCEDRAKQGAELGAGKTAGGVVPVPRTAR